MQSSLTFIPGEVNISTEEPVSSLLTRRRSLVFFFFFLHFDFFLSQKEKRFFQLFGNANNLLKNL